MFQWNSCKKKPDVLTSIQGLRKLVKADHLHLFCDKKALHSASLVFVFFVLHLVLFRPYRKCEHGLKWCSFG